jgi:hypothetical protein
MALDAYDFFLPFRVENDSFLSLVVKLVIVSFRVSFNARCEGRGDLALNSNKNTCDRGKR